MKTYEETEQRIVAEYLDLRGYLWCHPSPNAYRGALAGRAPKAVAMAAGRKAKLLGVKAGVPDILIFEQKGYAGLAIELKRKDGGCVTREQRRFLAALRDRGWATHVAHGATKAIEWLHRLGL